MHHLISFFSARSHVLTLVQCGSRLRKVVGCPSHCREKGLLFWKDLLGVFTSCEKKEASLGKFAEKECAEEHDVTSVALKDAGSSAVAYAA